MLLLICQTRQLSSLLNRCESTLADLSLVVRCLIVTVIVVRQLRYIFSSSRFSRQSRVVRFPFFYYRETEKRERNFAGSRAEKSAGGKFEEIPRVQLASRSARKISFVKCG